MPIQKLQFSPGVKRDNTTLTGEGGWYECDKIRFRSGAPEKIGGWVRDTAISNEPLTPTGGASFWGIGRWLFDWLTLSNINVTAIGTNCKLYVQNSSYGVLSDITPVRLTTAAGTVTLAATLGSSVITATYTTSHNAAVGDFFTISGATSLGGAITSTVLNSEFKVVTVSGNSFTFDCGTVALAGDTGNGGALLVVAFQLNCGPDISYPPAGWGANAWGAGAWGNTAATAGTTRARIWSGYNYGEYLLTNPRYGAIYMWVPNSVDPYTVARAVQLSPTSPSPYTTDADCPTTCTYLTVTDNSRFVVAFGCNDYGTTARDPMLIRWSDQENYAVWSPQITNQAGSYRLSRGSEIQAVQQTRQEVLIWTDAALYSMQYIGAPLVWGFNILGDNISIAGPNTVAVASNVSFWMGVDKFYAYTGRVETLPCTLRQYIFGDMNLEQGAQFFAGTNEGFHEIWWFYCSANSTTIDRYVIYNYMDKAWSYGTMARTAWLDTPLNNNPIALGYNGQILYHENGVDDGSTNPASPIYAYIQSSDFDIGDGDRYAMVTKLIPDIGFDGSTGTTPEVTITVRPRQNPGSAYNTAASNPAVDSLNDYSVQRNYQVQRFTEIVYLRARGRQMAFKVESNTLGTQWQLGTTRLDVRPDGRRS